ncbi:MAG: hypothetical protein HY852_13375 [Bradyrhizobium sp.]|uniref:hypothetical protein n=1 Tax=Bradyrhizobium sp. TaxID=376 RepID=UPI0025C326EF|nr:hypothetical protein [Bradyrhizobium sp.]MBI5262797.1 hypothetical protein [Bradyrhizobium sp.]
MIGTILVALIAGCASALMFASITSGALISLVLICLAPMPLMVAALGWGSFCVITGGLLAMLGLGAAFGLPISIAFGLSVALPAWWLGHLALLGRPSFGTPGPDEGAPAVAPELEWYPIGRILLWITALAALVTMASLLSLGSDATTISGTLRRSFAHSLRAVTKSAIGEDDPAVHALVAVVPILLAMSGVTTLTLNLWLAAKVTATSGRLRRPWPDLKTVTLPRMTLAVLCLAIAFCFTGGLVAIFAEIVTTSLMMAYAITGFAVLHTLTLALKSRPFWLGSAYAIVVMFVWPVLAVVLLGLADAVFGFRERFLRGRPPPLPTP